MLTDLDRNLLRHYLDDADKPLSVIALQAGMTAATAKRRIDRMSEKGLIKGQHAMINWAALGYAVEVSLRFTLEKTNPRAFDEFLAAAREIPDVIEIQTFLGRVDVRLSVISRDIAHYQNIYRARILSLPHIADIEALMHVASIKTSPAVPL